MERRSLAGSLASTSISRALPRAVRRRACLVRAVAQARTVEPGGLRCGKQRSCNGGKRRVAVYCQFSGQSKQVIQIGGGEFSLAKIPVGQNPAEQRQIGLDTG